MNLRPRAVDSGWIWPDLASYRGSNARGKASHMGRIAEAGGECGCKESVTRGPARGSSHEHVRVAGYPTKVASAATAPTRARTRSSLETHSQTRRWPCIASRKKFGPKRPFVNRDRCIGNERHPHSHGAETHARGSRPHSLDRGSHSYRSRPHSRGGQTSFTWRPASYT
jgi:hypothetical protein